MYGEMFNYKINLDDNAKDAAKIAFDVLSDGNDYFDYEMFQDAKAKNPLLLEWLDEPESLVKQSQNRKKEIKIEEFEAYHKQVVQTVKDLET
jgi:hypothetical protein